MAPVTQTVAYGPHPDQWIRVHGSAGASRGTVVVLHGGFWKAQYTADLAEPLSADLAARGWTAVTVEYRRVGAGGGFPETFDDVHAALGAVPDPAGTPLVTLGHSAGGHLAAWAAARGRFERWQGGPAVTHVLSQAGVLDLAAAWRDHLGSGAVRGLLGGGPDEVPDAYDLADPSRHLPLDAPLVALHARDDDEVPYDQAVAYVDAAREAGGTADLVEVAGGHYDLIDVDTPAWAAVVTALDAVDA